MNSKDVDGSYPGSTENMRKVGTKNGVAVMKCLHCGKEVPKNWGNAKRHTCGAGVGAEGPGCCDDPDLTDHFVTHEDTGTTKFRERKKRCENCGTVHPLDVMERTEK